MTERKPRAPAGLASRGRRFWARTVDKYTLSDSELEVLIEVCRNLDQCEELQAAIVAEGVSVTGSKGQPRTHPALAELRQARLATARLLAALALPDEDDQAMPSPTTLRARAAAHARWSRRDALDAERRSRRGSSPA